MKKSLALIDDLIALEQEREKKHRAWCYANHKAIQSTGESEILFHLKLLKELVAEEGKFKFELVKFEPIFSDGEKIPESMRNAHDNSRTG